MSASTVAITPGTGANIDTRTEDLSGYHRQVIVIGDPSSGLAVAPVDATKGLKVWLGTDNGVSGTVTANAGTNLNTSLLALESGGNIASLNTLLTALSKTEDAAHASGDKGLMPLAVRSDSNVSLVTSDGDYGPLQLTADGALKVAITAGAGSGGTSMADKAAFTTGTTSATPIAGLYLSSEDTLTSGTVGAIGLDSARNVKTHEQYAPTAEDNTNQVIASQIRPVSGSTYSASEFAIYGTDVDLSAKATAGNLMSIYASNENAAVRYLQLHNKASAPTSSDVPVVSLPIAAGTANNPGTIKLGRDIFGEGGKYFSTGISIGISTTKATFTAATATEHDYYGQYK